MRGTAERTRRLGAEDGFTLIELLASMSIFSAFLAGVVVLFTTVFHTTASTNARAALAEQSQVRFGVLVHDLQNAVTCSSPAALNDGTSGISVAVSGTPTTAPTTTTIQMCDPAPGYQVASVSSGTNLLPATAVVTWTCNATGTAATGAAGTCTRCATTVSSSTTAIPASCPSTASAVTSGTVLTNTLVGVQQFGLTGLSAPALTTSAATTLSLGTLSSGDYALGAASATSSVPNVLSWVGISADLAQLEQTGTTPTAIPGSHPVALQTGAALRNYGV